MLMKVDGEPVYEVSITDEDDNHLNWGVHSVTIDGPTMEVSVSDPPEPEFPTDEWPEIRNRAFAMTGESRGGKDHIRRQPEMTESSQTLGELFGTHGEQDTETVYVVVDDGEIGVMTEHHSVVESYVADSLVEGQGATIDVQTFEVDL